MKYPPLKAIEEVTSQTLAVKLTAAGERSVLQGHPWVFSNSIVKVNKEGNTGDICIIFSKNKNKVMGVGLLDLSSPIRIKMIHTGEGIKIDEAFFKLKISTAFKKRKELLATNTNSYRLIFGENDGFPGLIVDIYDKVAVVKLYSGIWWSFLSHILNNVITNTNCETIVLRLSRKMTEESPDSIHDGQIIYGDLLNEEVEFIEHDVHFSANVIKGHKTGYFLDHRHNRKKVGELSMNRSVLDVFSYAGGFSVHALVGGATEVTSVDISAHALELAKKNAQLNSFKGIHKTIVGDAFQVLQSLVKRKKSFDVVVIDPPSFAKQQSEVALAKKKYGQLAQLGIKLCKKGGLLVLASCSSRVTAQAFYDINKREITSSGRSCKILLKTTHDIDHPIGFSEGAYLKCGYYLLE